LIQNLRLQEASQQAQLQQLSAKFGPAYPKLAEMRGNLEAVQAAIREEVSRVARRAHNDYLVAATDRGKNA
jgi:succinoglycan biosynthesis transport protein ExoP